MTPSTTRGTVLALLRRRRQPMSVNDLAERLGVHANTVRFHLERLLECRQVERVEEAPRGPGRPAARFRAAEGMDPQGPRHYQSLAETLVHGLAGAPDPARRARDAGRAWGERLAAARGSAGADPVATLTQVLDEQGFAPRLLDGDRVGLAHCPFLELAVERREIVCSVHLGLMRGTLGALESDVKVTRLEPFAQPDLCVAHLARKGRCA